MTIGPDGLPGRTLPDGRYCRVETMLFGKGRLTVGASPNELGYNDGY